MTSRRRVLLALATVLALGGAAWLVGTRDAAPPRPEGAALVRPGAPFTGAARAEAAPGEAGGSPTAADRSGAPARSDGRARVPRVTGRVEDERGVPVAGAEVRAEALDPRALRGGLAEHGDALGHATSDADGRFEVPVREAGWSRIRAEAAGHGTADAWAAGPGAWVLLTLPDPGTLDVRAVDGDGAPVADAHVDAWIGRTRLAGTTDGDGTWHDETVPPGSAKLRATAPDGREGEAGPVAVSPGASTHVLVVLAPAVALGGRVVDARSGLPVEGAEVDVARPGRGVSFGTTGPDGTFGPAVAGPAGARVLVAARAPGRRPTLLPVVLAAGAPAMEVRVPLSEASDVAGRVVDDEGRPVAGARVTTTSDGVLDRAPPGVTTDEQGRFALPPPGPPAPGRRVSIVAEGPEGRAALSLRPDETVSDVVLVLVPGATVQGRVVDGEGRALAGVVARLEPVWGRLPDRGRPGARTSLLLSMSGSDAGFPTASTDAEGRFEVRAVPRGPYDVRLARGALEGRGGSGPVEVEGDLDLGTLVLGSGRALEGRVLDLHGAGIPGAQVDLAPAARPDADPAPDDGAGDGRPAARAADLPRHATTGADGSYRVLGVGPGTWRVTARRAGLAPDATEVEVLATGPFAGPADLVLEDEATVEGVLSEGDAPFRRPFEVVLEAEGGGRRRVGPVAFRSPEGRFEVDGVPAGSWRVLARTFDGRIARPPEPLDVRAGGRWPVRLELERAASLTGRLRGPDGAPVAAGRVTLRREADGTRRSATTDAAGRFEVADLAPGSWRVRATGRGGAPVETLVVLPSGPSLPVDLALARGGALEVSVTAAGGGPVPGALVLVRPPEDAMLESASGARTDARGRLQIDDLPPGDLEVVAIAADGRRGGSACVVSAGGVATVAIEVAPTTGR